jgi:hypothetical protein
MLKMDQDLKAVLCAHCESINLHPAATYCSSGDDDYGSREQFEITKTGKRISISKAIDKIGNPNVGNRARELDTVIRFWCEQCHKMTRVDFGFHKGSVLFNYSECVGTVDFDKNGNIVFT